MGYVFGTADYVLADIIIDSRVVQPEKWSELQELAGFKQERGVKIRIDVDKKDKFNRIANALDGVAVTITPGGSSANTLHTANGLIPELSTQFLGIMGQGVYSNMIASSFARGKIHLVPDAEALHFPQGFSPETAVSFVFVYKDRQRNIITYPGNASHVLTYEFVKDLLPRMMAGVDAIFMQGSMWKKFDPRIANDMYRLAKEMKRPVWLALPTNAFSPQEKENEAKLLFGEVMHKATVIMGNDSEIARMYNREIKEAANQLRADFAHRKVHGENPVAMITSGDLGAIIITAEKIEHVKADYINDKEKEEGSALGCGDTSFGFFIAALLAGKSPLDAGRLAMKGACAKMRVPGARLDDPARVLASINPEEPALSVSKAPFFLS